MNSSANNALARKLTFDSDTMWIELADGRKLGVPLAYFPGPLNATPEQRASYFIEEEMKDSYIDYSMSVIVSRALPDVRDGSKLVQQRVLYGNKQ